MDESHDLHVGGWYYIDRIDGASQEQVVAAGQKKIVVRDLSGNLSTIDPGRVIAVSSKPFLISDLATTENASLALAFVIIAITVFRENKRGSGNSDRASWWQ